MDYQIWTTPITSALNTSGLGVMKHRVQSSEEAEIKVVSGADHDASVVVQSGPNKQVRRPPNMDCNYGLQSERCGPDHLGVCAG